MNKRECLLRPSVRFKCARFLPIKCPYTLLRRDDIAISETNGIITLLEDFLFSFVSEMKNLVALCLVGFEMDPILFLKVLNND